VERDQLVELDESQTNVLEQAKGMIRFLLDDVTNSEHLSQDDSLVKDLREILQNLAGEMEDAVQEILDPDSTKAPKEAKKVIETVSEEAAAMSSSSTSAPLEEELQPGSSVTTIGFGSSSSSSAPPQQLEVKNILQPKKKLDTKPSEGKAVEFL